MVSAIVDDPTLGGRHLRWSQGVECPQKGNQPDDGVAHFDGELHRREKEWEQADVAGDRQRPEGAEIAAVLECHQTEWDDDKQDRLLVDVPAEEKRRVATECDGADEGFPGRLEEQSEKNRLKDIS